MASISSLGIGSGLPLTDLLDQLESAEREQLTPITTQQSSYKAKISALGKLESALDKLQQAAAKLTETDSFQAVSSKVSGSELTASSDTTAVPGTYKVHVTQLAQAHSLASLGVEGKTAALGSGKLTISQADAEDIEVTMGSEDSLEDLRDAINDANGGVTASIINDGSETGYRLVLTSKETGQDSAITVSVTADDPDSKLSTQFDMQEQVMAQDAELTVNNIAITSASNHVEEAIQGVSLDLESVSETEESYTSIKVARDEAAIEKNVQSFVDAYNSLQTTMDSLASFDSESGAAGELLGDSTLRSVESRLRGVMSGGMSDGDFRMLSDIGVELKLDGKLEVDSDKLGEAVSGNLSGLQAFFTGGEEGDGLASKLDESLSAMLADQGLLDTATTGYEDRIEALGERYTRTEESINNTIARYRQQFAQMDSLVSQMNSTMSYLTQQFEAMDAQLGRD